MLHTAVAVLLNRLGAGDDLVIGTPVDTRAAVGGHHDFRKAVGMFVNTVALRSTIDRAASAQSLVEQTRDADLDAWDHLTAPFDDIVSALNPPRLSGRSPLFQVALSVHDFADSISGEHLPVSADLIGEIAELDTHAAKFDLQFTVTGMNSSSSTPNLSLTYARNRYDDDQAAELSVRLLRVVRAIVADPQRRVGDIRITDPLEADALTPVSGPPATTSRTFAELLDDAVRRNPDGIAVTTGHPGTARPTSATVSSFIAPTGWLGGCSGEASRANPSPWWRWRFRARRRRSPLSGRSSGPVPPTCRWIRRTPPIASPTCSTTQGSI